MCCVGSGWRGRSSLDQLLPIPIAADAIMWSSDLRCPLNPCGGLYNGLYLDDLCLGLRVGVIGRVSRGQISGVGL